MPNAADALRALHEACEPGCLVERCRVGDCTLITRGRCTVINCDACHAFDPAGEHPDFVILDAGNRQRWVVVEMKAGHIPALKAARQLQAGADAVATEARFAIGATLPLLPLLLREGRARLHTADYQALRATRVAYRGNRLLIKLAKCGASLSGFGG